MHLKLITILLLSFALHPSAAALMLLEDELTPRPRFSESLLVARGGHFSARLITSVGQDVVHTPINEQTERRLFAALGIASRAGVAFSDKLRVDLSASAIRAMASTLVEENSGWKKDEMHSEVVGGGQARLLFRDGIRAGAGVIWISRPSAQETFEFAGQSALKRLSGYSLWTPDFSLIKEGGAWSAGFGWRPRATKSRTFSREGDDGRIELSENVTLDELWSAGVQTQLPSNRILRLDVNLHGSAVTESSEEQKTPSSASADSTDIARRRYEVALALGLGDMGGHRLTIGGAYQSIAYSEQSYVSAQTIPLWSVFFRDEFNAGGLNIFVDSSLSYGTDLQSLPDLNANYSRVMFSVQSGVQF
ncbi:MAG: hypothetical protein RLZZ488_664 [Pseudomonadota bacterium]